MDPMMLTSVVLLANDEEWTAPAPRRRSPRLRAALARALRSLAVAIEVKPATDCLEPAAAR
jgi:hypothetical protein